MQLVDVDFIQAQPLQLPSRASQVLGTAIDRPLAGSSSQQSAFGGDDEVLRIGIERVGDQLLAHVRPIGVGRIDQVDA